MRVTVQREPSKDGATLSRLSIDGVYVCDIIEDVVREVPGAPVEKWKVKGETAIPAGVYRLTLETSQRFGPETLTVSGVNGFVGIRMHGGNTAADTEGCPLPGWRNGTCTVTKSQRALKAIRSIVVPEIKSGRAVMIEYLAARK